MPTGKPQEKSCTELRNDVRTLGPGQKSVCERSEWRSRFGRASRPGVPPGLLQPAALAAVFVDHMLPRPYESWTFAGFAGFGQNVVAGLRAVSSFQHGRPALRHSAPYNT